MDMRFTGASPIDDVIQAVHRWSKDGMNHKFERAQLQPGAEVFWPKCMSGPGLPQRMTFVDEPPEELGPDRDTSNDHPECFSDEPRHAKRRW
jgi:hypothetical protein